MSDWTRESQSGSATLTGIAALTAIAFASFYVVQNQRKLQDEVSHARVTMTNEAAGQSNLNAVAQFKALLNNGKVGSDYLPALFPQNYWLADWSQITKNPQIPSADVQPLSGSEWVKMSLVDTGDLGSSQLTSVLQGTNRQTMLKPQEGFVRIIKANFAKTVNFDYVESVDVEVKTTKVDKDRSSTIVSKARIPVPVPQPSDPILEISPKDANVWTSQMGTVTAGDYDIRVKASGVVYKAMIYVNNELAAELGVFNEDTGEPTNHKATNVLAKNEVIGQTTYTFQGFVSDPKNCALAPVNGQYSIKAVLFNAKGVISEAQSNIATQSFTVTNFQGFGKDLTDEEFKAACPKECPWYEGDSYQAPAIASAQARKYGDYSRNHQMTMRNDQLKIKSVKFCENIKIPSENFIAKNGRPAASFDELSSVGWEDLTYIYYTVPQCKRNFLFQRGACGCFADETLITMGDGNTQKKITELTAQDRVWNPLTKKSQAILRMTQGPEAVPMFDVTIEGKTVRVTGHHPFPTAQGPKPAFDLKDGDKVFGATGKTISVESIALVPAPEKAPIVWNLELEGSSEMNQHYVLANGVITGDLYIQTKLQNEESTKLSASVNP